MFPEVDFLIKISRILNFLYDFLYGSFLHYSFTRCPVTNPLRFLIHWCRHNPSTFTDSSHLFNLKLCIPCASSYFIDPLTPRSETQQILLCLTPDDFSHELGVSQGILRCQWIKPFYLSSHCACYFKIHVPILVF